MADLSNIKWERIPGDKARRYRNAADHKQIISRRYYDEHFGRMAGTGLTNETLAKKNKEENPLLSATRPRRGVKQQKNSYPKLRKLIFGNARLAHGKTDTYIGHFEFAPDIAILSEVIATAIRFSPRMLYYIEVEIIDLAGNKSIKSVGRYSYLPKTIPAIMQLWDDILGYGGQSGYVVTVLSIIFNYRYRI